MAVSDRTIPRFEPPLETPEEPRQPQRGGVDFLLLLWNSRRFLWSVTWKTAVVSYAIALLLPVHYQATVKLVPAENSSGGMMSMISKLAGGGGAAAGLGLDPAALLGMKTPAAFYIEVLKSRTVQDRMIDRFDLRKHYHKVSKYFPSDYYTTRKALTSFTSMDEDKKSGVLTLEVTDYKPQMAADMANAYVEEMNKLAADLNTSDAHREKEFLESRLKGARGDLANASKALSQFSSSKTIMDPQNQGKAMMDAAARLQGELIATDAELRGLEQIYSSDNTRVRTLKARQQELQAQLRKMLGQGGSTAPDDSAGNGADYPSLRSLPILGSQYADLYREAKIQEAVYEFLTQQYEMAKIREAKELPSVRVMDKAIPPERKSGPIRTLIVALSVISALMLTCCFLYGRAHWAQLAPDDSRRVLSSEIAAELSRLIHRKRRE
ncbi:MAG TPA: GNVR domain-containing protein [Candidatus Angelobacter sp.]|nr:GNVR domain-containing protein [Candidatus Angelobacter sp.]